MELLCVCVRPRKRLKLIRTRTILAKCFNLTWIFIVISLSISAASACCVQLLFNDQYIISVKWFSWLDCQQKFEIWKITTFFPLKLKWAKRKERKIFVLLDVLIQWAEWVLNFIGHNQLWCSLYLSPPLHTLVKLHYHSSWPMFFFVRIKLKSNKIQFGFVVYRCNSSSFLI